MQDKDEADKAHEDLVQEAALELHGDRIREDHLAGDCRSDGTRYPEGEAR